MNDEQKPASGKAVAAFVVSLIAGIWMLFAGGMMGWGYWGGHGGGGHMMSDGRGGGGSWMWNHQMMHGYGGGTLWSWIGIVAGITVLAGAIALYSKPASARSWGIVILVVSVVGLIAGAGGFLAGVVGAIGGILAITWKPQTS